MQLEFCTWTFSVFQCFSQTLSPSSVPLGLPVHTRSRDTLATDLWNYIYGRWQRSVLWVCKTVVHQSADVAWVTAKICSLGSEILNLSENSSPPLGCQPTWQRWSHSSWDMPLPQTCRGRLWSPVGTPLPPPSRPHFQPCRPVYVCVCVCVGAWRTFNVTTQR